MFKKEIEQLKLIVNDNPKYAVDILDKIQNSTYIVMTKSKNQWYKIGNMVIADTCIFINLAVIPYTGTITIFREEKRKDDQNA